MSSILTAIDFETTGTSPGWPSEPWQIGICQFRCNGYTTPEILATFSSFLRIPLERPFNNFTPGRHAQLRDELAISPTIYDIWEDIFPFLDNTTLVAHNLGTERSILRRTAPLHHFDNWIDTLALARAYYPGLTSYALEDLSEILHLTTVIQASAPPHIGPHDALYGAISCAHLYAAIKG